MRRSLLLAAVAAIFLLSATPAFAQGPPKGLPKFPACTTLNHLHGKALYQHAARHLFGKDYPRAAAIIQRESHWTPRAKNPYSTASGLCQWLAFWWNGSSFHGWSWNPFDWRLCLRVFRYVTKTQGWGAWAM